MGREARREEPNAFRGYVAASSLPVEETLTTGYVSRCSRELPDSEIRDSVKGAVGEWYGGVGMVRRGRHGTEG